MIQPPSLAGICANYNLRAPDFAIEHVYHSSKDVTPESIFFALPGNKIHGASFASEAISKGAKAVFTDSAGALFPKTDLPVVVVSNPRSELANVAAHIYGPHIADLHLWGITGTNGKTTTSYFLRQLLPQPAAVIGTTGIYDGKSRKSLARTTPEIDDLYRVLISLRKSGVKKIVLEVSSHALALDRVTGLKFQAVAFTNLSQDHLDFHKTMEAYLQAKAKLFDKKFSEYAVVCTDTAEGRAIADLADANGMIVATVSTGNNVGTWTISDELVGVDELSGRINPVGLKLKLNFGGRFNFANALLAVAMADQVAEVSQDQIDELAKVEVPGRMQVISGKGVKAIVDYAHSPAAIASVVSEMRTSVPGTLIVVIGAGGDRDSSKRKPMGSALTGADLVLVTDDNPRNEDPQKIRVDLIAGVAESGIRYREIPDRRAAIAQAISEVKTSNDLVMVLGKGHEQGQQIGDIVYEFDDVTEVREAIAKRELNE